MGRFESASYGLTQNDGEVGLLVTVREKNYAPPVLQLAADVNGTQPDNVTFTMGGRLTVLDIAEYGSELAHVTNESLAAYPRTVCFFSHADGTGYSHYVNASLLFRVVFFPFFVTFAKVWQRSV